MAEAQTCEVEETSRLVVAFSKSDWIFEKH
jgi:hypothetical protein